MELNILYEDAAILVCHKPAGVATQSNRIGEMDMVSLMANYRSANGQDPYVGLVHRLDQPVEGVMVFAKTKKAAAELSRQVSSRQIVKQYYAIVEGYPGKEEGELTDYLVRDGRTNTSRVTSEKDPRAKRAVLSYQVMEELENKSLLLITLHTGRHHQIRVQLAHAGFPVVGDRKYGLRSSDSPYMPLGLCSCRLNFVHPTTGKEMEFTICPEGQAFAGVTPWFKRLPEKP